MPNCLVDIPQIKIEYSPNTVFYADSSITVQKQGRDFCLANSSGEVQSKILCPTDHRHFTCTDLDSSLLFTFSGKTLVLVDKSGIDIVQHELDDIRIGRCATPIFLRPDNFTIIFGTKIRGQVQFLVYDFMSHKRVAQSASWRMNDISDLVVVDNRLYALLDKTFLLACDTGSCETLWTRFETGEITPKVLPDKGALWYVCRGTLKNYSPVGVNSMRVPLVKISTLEYSLGSTLYMTSKDRTTLVAFDYMQNRVLWQIPGSIPIEQSLPIKIRTSESKVHDALAIRLENAISIVDLADGRTVYYNQMPEVFQFRITDKYLLGQKYSGGTYIISGTRDENS